MIRAKNAPSSNTEMNKLLPEDRPAHDWYRFVLSFPPHLIRQYLQRLEVREGQRVLDPFCGTGTTLVECKKLEIASVGVEANPLAFFASSVKLDWSPDPTRLFEQAHAIVETTLAQLDEDGIEDEPLPLFRNGRKRKVPVANGLRTLPAESSALLLSDSISALPLHKTLVLLEKIKRLGDSGCQEHLLLALMKVVVFSASNLHFGPEVGVRSPKDDAAVVLPWLNEVRRMADDLTELQRRPSMEARALHGDARGADEIVEPSSVDAVITSPPYPNEKDYSRTTRLESVLLGMLTDKTDLRALKKGLLRSNTRGVYKGDDDDQWIADHPEIDRIAKTIERKRIQMGKTSGFERMYSRVTKLYFGGMARHLSSLREVLRPGARLAYVVGDQASYLQVMIRTGQLIERIAKSLGYEPLGIDLFRTRLSTATRKQLREEVVLLRWPGNKKRRAK